MIFLTGSKKYLWVGPKNNQAGSSLFTEGQKYAQALFIN